MRPRYSTNVGYLSSHKIEQALFKYKINIRPVTSLPFSHVFSFVSSEKSSMFCSPPQRMWVSVSV
uniref:Uncharacterized protein n=1 Tax=Anguilla anguilla TaxID=7936 RepID=A0A0E9VC27_ANGAN